MSLNPRGYDWCGWRNIRHFGGCHKRRILRRNQQEISFGWSLVCGGVYTAATTTTTVGYFPLEDKRRKPIESRLAMRDFQPSAPANETQG
jgi:hypothetical protein